MPEHGNETVPEWNGDPASFETFATACRWFEHSLKEADRRLAAPRIWAKRSGAAKSVVRHLEPQDFDSAQGVSKLLTILRESPLQTLPIPDSFSRLERWSSLRRQHGETIPRLLVREEELFVELQNALKRARSERLKIERRSMAAGVDERDPSTSPSRSPQGGGFGGGVRPGDPAPEPAATTTSTPTATSDETGFFENELRGFRLLKAAKLSQAERQHVMTLTKNSTHFHLIRQALRSLFADADDNPDGMQRSRKVWYSDQPEAYATDEETAWWNYEEDYDDSWDAGWSDWSSSQASWDVHWNEGSPSSWANTWDDYTETYVDAIAENEVWQNDEEKTPEEVEGERRVEEAYTLAAEANRTLSEAKQAIAKVRAARGYFDPSGVKGSPTRNKGKSKGKGKTKSKGSGSLGPCFTCGRPGHTYMECPDRWSGSSGAAMMVKGKSKGKGKKGSKGKMKGKTTYFTEYHPTFLVDYDNPEENVVPAIYVLSMEDVDSEFYKMAPQKVLLDTGATESVAGVAAMSRVIEDGKFDYTITLNDRPKFKFGNGGSQRAVSRINLECPALGQVAFYLLDGGADYTPPLLGARDLRRRHSLISYKGDWLAHRGRDAWWASSLESTGSGHLALNLLEKKEPLQALLRRLHQGPFDAWRPGDDRDDDSRGDDDDGGDDPRRKSKRARDSGDRQLGRLVQLTTQTGAYGGPGDAEGNTPYDGVRSLRSTRKNETPMEDDAMTEAAPAPSFSPTSLGEEPEGPVKAEGLEQLAQEPISISSTSPSPIADEGGDKPEAKPCQKRKSDGNHEGLLDEHDDDVLVTVEDDVEPGESRVRHVLMVVPTHFEQQEQEHQPIGERLSCLALRLNQLQQELHGGPHEIRDCFVRDRPSPNRLAMSGTSSSWTTTPEPVRPVASMCGVWPPSSLHPEGQCTRRDPCGGTPTRSCTASPGRVEGSIQPSGDDGTHLQCQADGDQRAHCGGKPWTRTSCCPNPSRRGVGPVDDRTNGGEEEQRLQGSTKDIDTGTNNTDPQGEGRAQEEEGTSNLFSQWPDGTRNRGDCPASSDDGAINACEDRDAGGAISACDGAINACDHRGPGDNPSGIIGGGELREGDQQSTSSLNSLWTALRGLQSRIRGVPTRKEETVETGAKIPEASAEISPIPLMHDDLNLSPITTTSTTPLEVSSGTFPTTTKYGKSRDEIDREVDAMWNMTEKTVRPSLARRLAQAAALAATVMAPLSDLMGMTTNNLDLMEIACAPTSTLTSTFLDESFQCRRINYKTGFDLETRKGTDLLAKEIGANPPRLGWVSMWCTRLSALQNLTMRTA